MNKAIFFLLGISLLSAVEISPVDSETFNSLIELYNNDELTRQQLLDAYDQLESEDLQQAARMLLEDLGTPIDELKAAALAEQELFTMTFDTLINMYKNQEITRAQLIKAYDLFETADDKHLGDQALNVLLNTSIDSLRQEEATKAPQFSNGRPRRAQRQRPAQQHRNPRCRAMRRKRSARNHHAEVAQRVQAQTNQLAQRHHAHARRQEPTRDHLHEIRESNKRRKLHYQRSQEQLRAEEQFNRVIRETSLENQEMQEAIKRSQEERVRPVAPLGNQPLQNTNITSQSQINRLLDRSLAHQEAQDRVPQELDLGSVEAQAPHAREDQRPAPQQRVENVPQPPVSGAAPVGNQPAQSLEDLMRQVQEERAEEEGLKRANLLKAVQEEQGPAAQKDTPQRAFQEPKPRKETRLRPVPPQPVQRNQEPEEELPQPQLFEEERRKARVKREQEQTRKLSALQKDAQGEQNTSAVSPKQSQDKETRSMSEKSALRTAKTVAPTKKVPFELPQEQSDITLQTPVKELRMPEKPRRAAPVKEAPAEAPKVSSDKVSVYLGLFDGSPVFNKGSNGLTPTTVDLFNHSIAQTDTDVLDQWGQQLAQLVPTDAERMNALKHIINAYKQENAPRAELNLLMKKTVESIDNDETYAEYAELIDA